MKNLFLRALRAFAVHSFTHQSLFGRLLVQKEENQELDILTRRIISFRKVGEHYRRSDEVHRQKLYRSTDIVRNLTQVGFEVETSHSYGNYILPKNHTAFIARKKY